MSLILDALNRARDGEQAVPNLATQHTVTESRWNRGHLLLGGALLLAIIIIIGLLVVPDAQQPANTATNLSGAAPLQPGPVSDLQQERPQAIEQTIKQQREHQPHLISDAAAANQIEITTLPSNLPAAATAGASPRLVSQDPAVSALYRTSLQVASGDTTSAVATGKSVKTSDASANGRPKSSGKAETIGKEQVLDIQTLLRKAQGELEDARMAEHSAPFIAALSQQKKDIIPTIYYERHEYSGKAAESQVVLGGKILKAGDRMSSGIQVDEILPDSVVLSYKGTQFRLRALNSWVNL